jgi:hypothetical protein
LIPHMHFPDLIASLQNAPPPTSDTPREIVRVVAGILALVMVGVILFRRKSARKDDGED